jgi:hypothetical protein
MSLENKFEVSPLAISTSTFKQQPGETLKDAWVRINRIHDEDSTPCEDEKLNLYFHYGLDPLYHNALDRATGGIFVLSTPSCAAITLRRIFGSFARRKKRKPDTTVQLALSTYKLESRLNKLPDREDFEHLELYSKEVIPRIDDKLVDMMYKMQLCEGEFLERKDHLNNVEKKVGFISNILEKDAPVKHYKRLPLQKRVWVKKEREVEEVKMLSEVKDPLLDLEKCSWHELMSILQKFASDPAINANQVGFGCYISNHVFKDKIARYK